MNFKMDMKLNPFGNLPTPNKVINFSISKPSSFTLPKLSSSSKPAANPLAISCSYNKESVPTTSVETPPASKGMLNIIKFETLEACKLGIARYPDFQYNAKGGSGTAVGGQIRDTDDDQDRVSFDVGTLYIPPLSSSTTKFLGLPLPPFLKIDIEPELFQGTIDPDSGKVELQFEAKFLFSVGSIYKAPPLSVKTILTSEESKGEIRSGRGERLDAGGRCRLVGVAVIDPIDDFFLNSFLGLPTECLADLNAIISFSNSC